MDIFYHAPTVPPGCFTIACSQDGVERILLGTDQAQPFTASIAQIFFPKQHCSMYRRLLARPVALRRLRNCSRRLNRRDQCPWYYERITFQQRYGRSSVQFPYGLTMTYGEIATSLGNPNLPCRWVGKWRESSSDYHSPRHRVIGKQGKHWLYDQLRNVTCCNSRRLC